jgi:hypothetical protein
MKNVSDIIECIMIQVALGSIWRVVISVHDFRAFQPVTPKAQSFE